jgi:hypothetical protein
VVAHVRGAKSGGVCGERDNAERRFVFRERIGDAL